MGRRGTEVELRRHVPALDLSSAAIRLPPARLVLDGASLDPLAHLYVPDEGGAIRTVIGSAHRHWYSLIPSARSGLWQPVESEGEEMLALDGEAEFRVHTYQAQAARLRMSLNGSTAEWIIDHLRQLRDGTVEAIEVKPHAGALDPETRLKLFEAARILGRLGWKVKVRFHEEIRGSAARQRNRASIFCDADVRPCGDSIAAFDRLMAEAPETTLGRLWDELPAARRRSEAMARCFMSMGRIDFDMDEDLDRGSRIALHPAPSFVSKIRFGA